MARLLFFGKLSDIAGARMREIPVPENIKTIADLIAYIGETNDALSMAIGAQTIRFAVNQDIVPRDFAIANSDEIAFLPPVSGG